jgi:hypothetical protein
MQQRQTRPPKLPLQQLWGLSRWSNRLTQMGTLMLKLPQTVQWSIPQHSQQGMCGQQQQQQQWAPPAAAMRLCRPAVAAQAAPHSSSRQLAAALQQPLSQAHVPAAMPLPMPRLK